MNLQNLDHAIAIMKRAGKVDMNTWQSGNIKQTEESKHICGSAACFAGWVAISPEWAASGGNVSNGGNPVFNGSTGFNALEKWLDIPEALSDSFVNGDGYDTSFARTNPNIFSSFYNKLWDDVNKEDVINKLEFLKVNGIKALMEQHLDVIKHTLTATNITVKDKLSDFDTIRFTEIIKDYQEVLREL